MERQSFPTKPHHFITHKTRLMIILFLAVLLITIGSYFYLLNKTNFLKGTSSNSSVKSGVTNSPKKNSMINPKEFSDENITFFYPDVLEVHDTTDDVITWNSVVSGTIITEKALQLVRQSSPFEPPTNIYNTKYFEIDDAQERDINGIAVMEYTINCGGGCSYRIDQFTLGKINYQLSFLIAGPGLSPRAEQILATLSPISPTPTEAAIGPDATQEACTMEAKLCSDGSSVGRTGPNCEFAACPK